jgi:hypothetical protein
MVNKFKIGLILLFVIGAGFLGYWQGHSNVKIVQTEKIVEHEVIKVVEVERKVTEKNLNESKHIHKERVEETHLDGTKTVKETTDIGVERVVKEVEIKYVDRTNTVEKIVEKQVLVNNSPDWTVSAKIGTSPTELKPSLVVPYFDPLILGVEVQRRIAGPFKGGVWVNTTSKLNTLSGGVSASMEF